MTEDCKRWDGRHRKEDGRPMIGRAVYAYRDAYERAKGPIPDGMIAHHGCENKWCINPEHIKLITQGQHLHEHGLSGDNHQADKTHCPAGHLYDEENTYRWRNERHCKTCRRATKLRWRAKQKK